MDAPSPLGSAEFEAELRALGVAEGEPVAVAVSGGADSMCLALLAHAVQPTTALTVDHGLRAGSADEARWVADQCKTRGLPHHILEWSSKTKPSANIQAAAREARYDLLINWCRNHGVKVLMTAHHIEDQAETFLLRLARGSGIYGLAAMAPARQLTPDVRLVRPFLNSSKAQLVETLNARGMTWIEDPSNSNESFERVKVRQLLAASSVEGLNAERLSRTAGRMRRTREALEFYESCWLSSAVEFHEAGFAHIVASALESAPEEIVLRALNQVIQFAGGGQYGPRMEKLERLFDALAGPEFKGHTLCGVRFALQKGGKILVAREAAAMEGKIPVVAQSCWDGRFDVHKPSRTEAGDLFCGALGEKGLRQVSDSAPDVLAGNQSIPASVLITLPAFFEGESLIAVPHLGYSCGNCEVPVLTHRWLASSKTG